MASARFWQAGHRVAFVNSPQETQGLGGRVGIFQHDRGGSLLDHHLRSAVTNVLEHVRREGNLDVDLCRDVLNRQKDLHRFTGLGPETRTLIQGGRSGVVT